MMYKVMPRCTYVQKRCCTANVMAAHRGGQHSELNPNCGIHDVGTHAADESVSQLLMEAAETERLRGVAPASPPAAVPDCGSCSGAAARCCTEHSLEALHACAQQSHVGFRRTRLKLPDTAWPVMVLSPLSHPQLGVRRIDRLTYVRRCP